MRIAQPADYWPETTLAASPEDAALIAAAPELLAACEAALKALAYEHLNWTNTYIQIQKAVTQAKGSPPGE